MSMKSSKIGVLGALLAVVMGPLGCEPSGSSSGGTATPDGGAFDPDAGNVDPPVASECVAPTKGPTTHGGGSTNDPANEVWTADASPHVLQYDTTIYHNVTLEPCAEVLLAGGSTLTVRGSLVANGAATKRVHIGGKDPQKAFASIRTVGGTIRLAYATVDGGGDPLNNQPESAGALVITGTDGAKPTQETLFVDHVTIAGSKSNGAVLSAGGGFAQGSQNLVVRGAAGNPINIWARAAGTLPAGSYTGNGTDAIILPGGVFVESATLRNLGVPYNVGTRAGTAGDLRVEGPAGGAVSRLTIEPGVTLRFKKDGAFYVSFATGATPATAALVAVGTADKPITFTSWEASPAPGDWQGISFGLVPLAANRLDFVRVEYAGGATGSESHSCRNVGESPSNNAGIAIYGPPPSQFITNTTIASSAAYGIERAWGADNLTDFLATNVFEQVALCNETYPRGANGACPASVPCVK
jgi:hypothetical protein